MWSPSEVSPGSLPYSCIASQGAFTLSLSYIILLYTGNRTAVRGKIAWQKSHAVDNPLQVKRIQTYDIYYRM